MIQNRIETLMDFLAACRSFEVRGSVLVCTAPADYNLGRLYPLVFYFSGEIFGESIHVHISLSNFVKFILPYASIGCKPPKRR